MNNIINPCFSIPIGKYYINPSKYKDLLDNVIKKTSIVEHPSINNGISCYNTELVENKGINIDVFSNDELKSLKEAIQSKIDDFTDKIGWESAILRGSWFNIFKKGGSIDTHIHANNYISGSYYYKVPKKSEPFQIQNPINSKCWNKDIPTDYNKKWVDIPVKDGSLVIFPSFLFHRVNSCNDISENEERITFSFNCLAKSNYPNI